MSAGFETGVTAAESRVAELGIADRDSDAAARPAVAATVLVNWKGVDDTLECLGSLLASDHPEHRIIVVDNGSRDGSLERIEAWASGRAEPRSGTTAGPRSVPELPKPIACARLTLDESLRPGAWRDDVRLTLIDAGRNHGFAGGMNIGLRFALSSPHVAYFWVLNNDTFVAPDCLGRLCKRMDADARIGMCGARLMYYWQPDRVQALGGARFIGLTGTSHLIGGNTSIDAQRDPAEVEASLDHLAGASMLVSRAFLQEVGLMDEDYFLYYEESDWAMRARGRFRLGYADDAVVYHKEGASIGSNHRREQRSRLADYFLVKSRLRFTRKFRPWALPGVVAYSALSAIKALASGHVGHGRAMLLAIIGISPESALGWRRD